MAHQNVFARRVELVSWRRSAHPPRTVAAPTAHPRRRHCSLLLSAHPVLVTLSASCELEFAN